MMWIINGKIIEKGLGYPVKYTNGETVMLNTALIQAKGAESPQCQYGNLDGKLAGTLRRGACQG